jgi:acetyl esterase/lipase
MPSLRSRTKVLPALLGFLLGSLSPVPAAQPVVRDIVYATVDRHDLRLDILFPKTPLPRNGYPLIISIHGGAWLIGDRRKDLFLRKLTEAGYAFASIDYRLSGEAKFPAQIDDVRTALTWLISHAASLHLDANRIGLTGASAGGHIALLLGLDPVSQPNPIKAICALYPPTDLISIIPPKDRGGKGNLVAMLLGGPISERLTEAREASPVSYADKTAPPILLIHGDRDGLVPISQSRDLNQALLRAGADSKLIVYQGKGHAFGLREDTLHEVTRFFDRHLKP